MPNFIHLFTQELNRPTPRVERLALAIAGMAYPDLDMALHLRALDDLAAAAHRAVPAGEVGRRRAQRFLHVFNHHLGFTGNHANYYDPHNSFLNVVLRERKGLPIMLSLLCMVIGDRLGLTVRGVGFPGHFMARYEDEEGAWLLDPFHGEVVDCADADHYLSSLFQRKVALPAAVHAAVGAPALAQRILNNLRNVYLSRGDYRMGAAVLGYLLVLHPLEATLWQERGLLHYYDEQWERATYDLKRYFFFSGHLLEALFPDEGLEAASPADNDEARQLLQTYRQIAETRRQIN